MVILKQKAIFFYFATRISKILVKYLWIDAENSILAVFINYFNLCFITADRNLSSRKLKHNVIEAVNELIGEIDACHEQIAEQAVEHIHDKYCFFPRIKSIFCLKLVLYAGIYIQSLHAKN